MLSNKLCINKKRVWNIIEQKYRITFINQIEIYIASWIIILKYISLVLI